VTYVSAKKIGGATILENAKAAVGKNVVSPHVFAGPNC